MAAEFAQDAAKRAKEEKGGIYLYFGHGTGTGGVKPEIDKESLKAFTMALKGLDSEKFGVGLLCCHAGAYLEGIPSKARMTTPLTETGQMYPAEASKYCRSNEKKILEWVSGILRNNGATADMKVKIHLYFGAMGDLSERDQEKYKESPGKRPVFSNWKAIGLK
jgi:hypothetical protein